MSTRRTRRTPARQGVENSASSGTVGGTGRVGDDDERSQPSPGRQLGVGEDGASRGNNNSDGQEHGEHMRDASEERTSEREDLAARHALLKARVATLRQRREIEDMERELAGGEPAYSVAVDGVAPARGHKRQVSDTAELPSAIHRKLATPPTYSGKSMSELRLYEAGWKTQFAAMAPFATEAARVLFAATSLGGEAVIEWGKLSEDERTEHSSTWDLYMAWCMSVISDPTNRRINASKRLKDARQKPEQSVRDLVHYIEDLERDLPYQADDSAKGYRILDALRPELHTEVVRELKDNITRGAVVSTATRHEELLKRSQKQSKPPSTTLSTRPFMPSTRTAQKTTETRTTDTSSTSERFQGECHYCKKKGHKAIDCNKKKAEEKLAGKPEESKNGLTKS